MASAIVQNRHINWVIVFIIAALLLLLLASPVGAACIPGEDENRDRQASNIVERGNPDKVYGPSQTVPREANRDGNQEANHADANHETANDEAMDDPFLELSQGRQAYWEGEYHWAVRHFERGVSGIGDDASFSMWAGMAAYRVGDMSSAERHWRQAADSSECNPSTRGWSAIGLTAVYLETDNIEQAARTIFEWERFATNHMLLLATQQGKVGNSGSDEQQISRSIRPVMDYYSGLVYERLASLGWERFERIRQDWLLELAPMVASNSQAAEWMVDGSMVGGSQDPVVPGSSSRSWMMYLAKRAYRQAMSAVQDPYWQAAPVADWPATMEPQLGPTVGEFLEAVGSADYARQAKQRLSALNENPRPTEPKSNPEIFDLPTGSVWTRQIC